MGSNITQQQGTQPQGTQQTRQEGTQQHGTQQQQQQECMFVEPQKEHKWLQKLVGKWTYEGEAKMGPDKAPEKFKGTENVRAIGDLWIAAEGKGEMPGSLEAVMLLTVGYDVQKKRFVSSWVGSMMTYLWVYEGDLDASGKVLTLRTEGPDMSGSGKTTKFKEVVEIKSDDQRKWISYMQAQDGTWQEIMRATYRRS